MKIGSMAFAVKWQMDYWGDNLRPGDVILSNSPGKNPRSLRLRLANGKISLWGDASS